MSDRGRGAGESAITPDEARRALLMWLRAAPYSDLRAAANRALCAFVDQYPEGEQQRAVEWLAEVYLELIGWQEET